MAQTWQYFSAHQFDYWQAGALPTKYNGHMLCAFPSSGSPDVTMDGRMPDDYNEGTTLITVFWLSRTATTGNVRWRVEVERLAEGGSSLGGDSFATAEEITDTVQGTVGELSYGQFSISHANMDSVEAGEIFRLRFTRDTGDAADTMVGDAEIVGLAVHEATP
jgi:hypothetical protein